VKRKSAEGISWLSILLANISTGSNVINACLEQWDTIDCCQSVGFLECNANLLSVIFFFFFQSSLFKQMKKKKRKERILTTHWGFFFLLSTKGLSNRDWLAKLVYIVSPRADLFPTSRR
jgi:hypothetical protein